MTIDSNWARGEAFAVSARLQLEALLGCSLETEVPIRIGQPPKAHRFDLANKDQRVAIECKAFTWTEGGNVPSAKLTTVREALLYLQHLPETWTKVIAMAHAIHGAHKETLAQYFSRLNAHLLGDVSIVEIGASGPNLLACRSPRLQQP